MTDKFTSKNNKKWSGKRVGRMLLILLFWGLLWEGLSLVFHNEILLPSPIIVGKRFWAEIITGEFWKKCAGSLGRILLGFLSGALGAYYLSLLFEKVSLVKEVLRPLILLMKATPVACVAVLILILAGSKWLVFWVVLSVVVPQILTSMEVGLKNVPAKMQEMGMVYGLAYNETLRFIKRPYYAESLRQGLILSLETSFKAGISAEIIGLPVNSLGEGIYLKKIYFDTAGVLAFVTVILLLSFLCGKILRFSWRMMDTYAYSKVYLSKTRRGRRAGEGYFVLRNIQKKYGEKTVLSSFSLQLERENRYLLTAPSGKGKTTLLKVVGGLLKPDAGECLEKTSMTMLFQENRLVEKADAVTNVLLGMKERSREIARETLLKLGLSEEDCEGKQVSAFSGGMKRKVALARTLLAEGELVLLDEPYASVDNASMQQMENEIMRLTKGKTCILSSHIPPGEFFAATPIEL